MRNLTLKQIRYFDAHARLGTFSAAAEACSVTQPALSMQIKELEDSAGSALLERGPREGVTRGWLRGHIARLVLAASRETPPPLPAPTPRSAFLVARLTGVENVLDGSTAPWEPVASPTLSNGLVLPEDLVDRLGRCADLRVPDLVAALLRLAPGDHDAARRRRLPGRQRSSLSPSRVSRGPRAERDRRAVHVEGRAW